MTETIKIGSFKFEIEKRESWYDVKLLEWNGYHQYSVKPAHSREEALEIIDDWVHGRKNERIIYYE